MTLLLLCYLLLVLPATALLSEEEEDALEEVIRNAIWQPVVENTVDELTRLDKSTKPFAAHATCGFSVHTDLSDYETAKQKCENSSWIGFPTPGGRKLASIHSELENQIASLMFQYAYNGQELEGKRYEGATNWAWIGLENVESVGARPDGAGKLVWNEPEWEWVDGIKMSNESYENWMTKKGEQIQPDMLKVGDAHQTAGRIFRKVVEGKASGIWDDTFKSKLHPYICKFRIPVHYVVFPELKTWHEAKADCERRGFYFAKIRNMAENQLFVDAVKRVYDDHRHEKKFHHENWIWIGATDLKESGDFEFYDGEPIKFTIPWAKKQHDNKNTKQQGSQDYAAVSRWGEWDDSYGTDWSRPYACQCNPHGVALNKEMEEINAEWEEEVSRTKDVKKERKAEKAAKRKARREAKRAKKEEKRQRAREEKKRQQQEKAEQRQENKAEKKSKKAERKASKKAAKAAKKEAGKSSQGGSNNKGSRAERKAARRKARKSSNQEDSVSVEKRERKAWLPGKLEKREKKPWIPGRLEKRDESELGPRYPGKI